MPVCVKYNLRSVGSLFKQADLYGFLLWYTEALCGLWFVAEILCPFDDKKNVFYFLHVLFS